MFHVATFCIHCESFMLWDALKENNELSVLVSRDINFRNSDARDGPEFGKLPF